MEGGTIKCTYLYKAVIKTVNLSLFEGYFTVKITFSE